MKLFLIEQDTNSGYDTYDSAVVAAPDERQARYIHPGQENNPDWVNCWLHMPRWWKEEKPYAWTLPTHVKVTYLGEARADIKQGVICSSYNPG